MLHFTVFAEDQTFSQCIQRSHPSFPLSPSHSNFLNKARRLLVFPLPENCQNASLPVTMKHIIVSDRDAPGGEQSFCGDGVR